LRFPDRSWASGINAKCAGEDNLEEAEFLEALHGGYAAGDLEGVRL